MNPRVLCVDAPIAHSETYMVTEISWLRAHGVDIALWTSGPRAAPGPTLGIEIGGTLAEATAAFKPDVMHRWTHANPHVEKETAASIMQLGVPLTIRGHSHGFSVPLYRGLRAAARIWLFPHHAELVQQDNVEPLPVVYDPAIFYPEPPQDYVVRAGSCRPGKDLEGFLHVAALSPTIKFVLILAGGDTRYIDTLTRSAPTNVTVYMHLPQHEAAQIVRRALVCLRSHDTRSHTYGMPMSIVEALGAGLPVIARSADCADAARFGPEIFGVDLLYETNEEAAQLVREVFSWSPSRYQEARDRSLARAAPYQTDVVLPRVCEVWRSLI